MEQWKAVPGWEGWYEVSDEGRVRSVARVSIAGGAPAHYQARVLRGSPGKNGYPVVSLSRPNYQRKAYVHSLVAAAFLGPRPEGLEVCHADGSRDNNRLSNLRYGTRRDNSKDMVAHGRAPDGSNARGEKNGLARLTEVEIRLIRQMSGTQKEIAEMFGVTPSNISCIQRRKTWAHVL